MLKFIKDQIEKYQLKLTLMKMLYKSKAQDWLAKIKDWLTPNE
jgi:hypothetical protein